MRRLTIKTKLPSIIALVALSMAVSGAMSLLMINKVRIGSQAYDRVIDGKDLIADVLPPPCYLIEANLNCFEMVNAAINLDKDPKGLDAQITRARQLDKEYQERLAYWRAKNLEPEILALLNDAVDPPAQQFFKLREEQLVPALQKGEFEQVNVLVFDTMKTLYDQHHAGINRLIQATTLHNESLLRSNDRTVTVGVWTMILSGGALSLVTGLIVWFIAVGINRNLGRTVEVLDAMAGGDTSRRLEVHGQDEIAKLSTAVNRTVDNMNGVVQAIATKAAALSKRGIELDGASRSLIADAERTVGEIRNATAAADQVSSNTGFAATSTDELRQAITKIAESVNSLSAMVEQGNKRAGEARDIISNLSTSSTEVGAVVKLIGRIAEQTNTLALNATIQAAAAGDAGRGFLVVANEVKELAKKTADATTLVAGSIDRIQKDTRLAVTAIGEVAGTINQITEFQQSVAAAMTEQSATTDVLAGTVQDVAHQAAAIATTVRQVNAVAEQTGAAASTVGHTAEAITSIASELAALSGSKAAAS